MAEPIPSSWLMPKGKDVTLFPVAAQMWYSALCIRLALVPPSLQCQVRSLLIDNQKALWFWVFASAGCWRFVYCVIIVIFLSSPSPALGLVFSHVYGLIWLFKQSSKPQKYLKVGCRSSDPRMRRGWENGVYLCPLTSDKLLDWFKLPCATSPFLNPRKLSNIMRNLWIWNSLFIEIFFEYLSSFTRVESC